MKKNAVMRENIDYIIPIDRNTFKLYSGNIYLIFNEHYFNISDVPSDGDCFSHSILKYHTLSEKFNVVQYIRIYLKEMVNYLIANDLVLQHLFTYL